MYMHEIINDYDCLSTTAIFGLYIRYYAYEFDWIRNVVTIKQSGVLTKFEKWWLSKPMCIEGEKIMSSSFFVSACTRHSDIGCLLGVMHMHVLDIQI